MMSDSPPYPDYVGRDVKLDQAFDRILKALINDNAQFLFGAGMSQSSGVPDGAGVLGKLLQDYFPKAGQSVPDEKRLRDLIWEFPFEAALEAIEKTPGIGRADLTKKLNDILLDPEYESSQAHRDFLSLCWGEQGTRFWSIFTTNFDDLLEQEIGDDRAKRITEKNPKDIREARQKGKIPVIHLHGVLDEDYQATESDVFRKSFRILHHEFEVALHYSDAFVFVGYSMNDPDFRQIYMRYRERLEERNEDDKVTYVVSPPKDEYSYALGKPLWESRGAIWLPLTAEVFFAKLKYFMETHYDAEVRAKVMKKYNLARDEELNDYILRTSELMRVSREDALRFLYEALPRGGGR